MITFPALRVNSHDLNKIRGKVRLEKYLLKNLANIKVKSPFLFTFYFRMLWILTNKPANFCYSIQIS